ncbi:MAG: DUF3187 family protein [Acidobacteriota bacterium]|jgi:hypothetical protein
MSRTPPLVTLTLAWAVGSAAQTGAPLPAGGAPPDPLRLASAPASLDELGFGAPVGWAAEIDFAYFNLWNGTWHTGTIHKEFGLLGTPLQAWELRTLEERHPADAIHRFDLEGWVGAVTVTRRLPSGLVVSARVPWLEVGSPHWDSLSSGFHRAAGLDQARRDWFPRGQSIVYAHYQGATIEAWEELRGSRLADATLAVSGPLGAFLGGAHRWSVAVQAPTGERGTLAGSGGWDSGVRWGAQWLGERHRLTAAAGYTWLDGSGSLLGARRSNIAYAQVVGARRLGSRTWFETSARVDSSPLAAFSPSAVGREAVVITLRLARPLGRQGWVAFELGENLPKFGAAPDFTLGLGVTCALGE